MIHLVFSWDRCYEIFVMFDFQILDYSNSRTFQSSVKDLDVRARVELDIKEQNALRRTLGKTARYVQSPSLQIAIYFSNLYVIYN